MKNQVETEPLGYSLDEARHRLRKPPVSRTGMYELIKNGLLEPAGRIGDRPYFTDESLRRCQERLLSDRAEAAGRADQRPQRKRLSGAGAGR